MTPQIQKKGAGGINLKPQAVTQGLILEPKSLYQTQQEAPADVTEDSSQTSVLTGNSQGPSSEEFVSISEDDDSEEDEDTPTARPTRTIRPPRLLTYDKPGQPTFRAVHNSVNAYLRLVSFDPVFV